MDRRLVMITGSSPGIGKTSVSALLHQQLAAHRIPSEWWQEERLESALRDGMPGWHVNLGDPEVFLAGCRNFVRAHGSAETVLITDAVLPGYLDLFGRRSPAELARFNRDLHETLAPLRPLLVYLHGDVETALARAVRQRGEEWLENIRRYLNSWRLPRYAAQVERFATTDDVTAYFTALDRASRRLVEAWPGASLLLSAEEMGPEDLTKVILRFVELDWLPIPATPEVDPPAFVGRYTLQGGGDAPEELVIDLADGRLHVDTYWPRGTWLLFEAADRFRLDSTDRRINFRRDATARVTGLTYEMQGRTFKYARSEQPEDD